MCNIGELDPNAVSLLTKIKINKSKHKGRRNRTRLSAPPKHNIHVRLDKERKTHWGLNAQWIIVKQDTTGEKLNN